MGISFPFSLDVLAVRFVTQEMNKSQGKSVQTDGGLFS
jgi:hypothetical protein